MALLLCMLLCQYLASANEQVISDHGTRHRRQTPLPHVFSRDVAYGLDPTTPEYGPWGPWTLSSECTRSCGGGIAYQDRTCMDVRVDGNNSCVGPHRRYFFCNIQDCPAGTRDFREQQCRRFNTVPHRGKYYQWIPYYNASNPCELNCRTGGDRFYTQLARRVIDGTRCHEEGSLDTCVDGVCVPVGCDKVLGSTVKEDRCGVCGGNGTCYLAKGVIKRNNFELGYTEILLVPTGATSILIEEVEPTNNFLAISDLSGKFHLNGRWKIQTPREVQVAGTIFIYKQEAGTKSESLQSKGPTNKPIFIVLFYQEKNLGISYEYSAQFGSSTAKPDSYSWRFGDFEECSHPCGGGVQYRPVQCIRNSDRDTVTEDLCDPTLKPSATRTCNDQPCLARWQIGEWSNCSHRCGGGSQFRLVFCLGIQNGTTKVLVSDNECPQPKPLYMRTCNEDKECPKWITSKWSQGSFLIPENARSVQKVSSH